MYNKQLRSIQFFVYTGYGNVKQVCCDQTAKTNESTRQWKRGEVGSQAVVESATGGVIEKRDILGGLRPEGSFTLGLGSRKLIHRRSCAVVAHDRKLAT